MATDRNSARCLECDTVIESKSRHDFVRCECGAIFVDGGQDYKRFGFTPGKRFELLYDEEIPEVPEDTARVEHYRWDFDLSGGDDA